MDLEKNLKISNTTEDMQERKKKHNWMLQVLEKQGQNKIM